MAKTVTIFEVGDWVQSSHPITVLNPEKNFQVYEVKYEIRASGGKFFYRGENTCWFAQELISQGEDPNFVFEKHPRLPHWEVEFPTNYACGFINQCVPEYNEGKEFWAEYVDEVNGWQPSQGFDTLEEAKAFLVGKYKDCIA